MKAGKLVKVRGARLPRGATMVGTEATPGFLRPWMKVDMGFCLVAQP